MQTGSYRSNFQMVWAAVVFGALVLPAKIAAAEDALIAVASNFLTTARTLESAFEFQTGHDVVIAHGSTGRLYAQIISGAPFDVYLAADQDRPEALEEAGLAHARKPYAIGQLVLVARAEPGDDLANALSGARVALANPDVAPYGRAACAALQAIGSGCCQVDARMGDSVGQAASMFATRNADYAFLAASQLPALGAGFVQIELPSDVVEVPQDAVLLDRAAENPAATDFFAFLSSGPGREIIRAAGYGVAN